MSIPGCEKPICFLNCVEVLRGPVVFAELSREHQA